MTTCLKNNRAFIGGIASAPTDPNLEIGDIYYNTTDDTMYRYDQTGEWVPLGSGGNVIVSLTAPVDPRKDDGWFDTGSSGLLYIWDEYSWVQVLDPKDANTTHVSTSAPTEPVVGDLWVDVANLNTLKLYYNGAWVTISTPPDQRGALSDLDDITNTTSATVEQYLTSNGNNTSSFASEVTQLQDLPDVSTASPNRAHDALVFNGTDYSFVERVHQLAQLEDVAGDSNATVGLQVLKADGDGTYSWTDNTHELEELTNVTGSTTVRHVLQSNGDGTHEFRTPMPPVHYDSTPPTTSLTSGRMWFDNSDTNNAGLYFYLDTDNDGTGQWISTAGGVHPDIQPEGVSAVTHTVSSDDADYVAVNGQTTLQEVRTSDYISDGDTFEIPANWWIWSDSTSTAALIVDTPNATIINNGKIIGRGGDGGTGSAGGSPGGAGGPAISVTASGVTIDNNSGAYIAGGGGGGAGGNGTGGTSPGSSAAAGGGGGAGGGVGGIGSAGNPIATSGTTATSGGRTAHVIGDGSGGVVNASGSNGGVNSQDGGGYVDDLGFGGQAGGTGGTYNDTSSARQYAGQGGGGGRILPGSQRNRDNRNLQGQGGYGGGGNNVGGNSAGTNASQAGGGGGGWGAAGGNSAGVSGGAGGAAVSGTYTQGNWQGTVYGSA